MEEGFLSVRGASFAYASGQPVFRDVSFDLRKGEVLTILGPNGAGKSTLLNCIGGLLRPGAGTIRVDGRALSAYSPRQLAQRIGYVPQMQARTYDFTVRDYIAMGRAPYIGLWQSPSREDERLVDEAMERMGLRHLAAKPYTHISGGEYQQVLIARVMVQQADVILMDEPTNHLDYGNQLKVLRQIRQLAADGYGLIWTTHMPDHALMLGGQIAVLDQDGVFETGDAAEMITGPRMERIYGARICKTYVEAAGRDACIPYRL